MHNFFSVFIISFFLSIIFRKAKTCFIIFISLFISASISILLFFASIRNFQHISFFYKLNQNKILNLLFSTGLNKNVIMLYFLGAFAFLLIKQKDFKVFLLSLCLMAIFLFVLYNALSTKIEYSRINLVYDNVEATKILQISDFHNQGYKDMESELIKDILNEKADIIILSGDFFDKDSDMKNCETLLSSIKDTAKIYYSLGNHEYSAQNLSEKLELIKTYNVNILSNEFLKIDGKNILIAGLDDPRANASLAFDGRFRALNEEMDFEGLKILISHRPEYNKLYQDSNFDLVFAGHAHGGQVRIPLLEQGLYAPNQGVFPDYTSGLYELSEKNKLIVSRGLFVSDHVARVFNRPNIVVVSINNG